LRSYIPLVSIHQTCSSQTSPIEPVYPVSTNGELFPWAQYRLPHSIQPLSYNLTLNPDLVTMTFTGQTTISMLVLHDTKVIVLHSSDLNISKASFKLGEEDVSDVTVLEYKPRDQIAIKFSKNLKAGQKCNLILEYSASLSNNYNGFYNSSYTDKDGIKRVLAATQFEPLSARKAFPCFDEPVFKAKFLIKISRQPNYITLSNMPKAQTTVLPNGLMQDEFEKTSVNMSTYLVAFVVAEFASITQNVSGTLVSVYSVTEKKNHTDYALATASKFLEFYNNYFEIKYPLEKLDLVAIPDFLAGAMENWGLITFRETSLLVGKQSSLLEKQVVASVIAHELAHQWFGNLVTMRWWNDLWLNEGFATYMQYMSLQKVLVLDKDALNSSHAVSTEVDTSEQVEEMFDSVSYEKGASILLMLCTSLLGEQQFRKGLIQYLKQYKGLNTNTEDLWNSLTQVTAFRSTGQTLNTFICRQVELSTQYWNVSEMMTSWTSQKGFPLVTMSRKGNQVTLTQEHFLLSVDFLPPCVYTFVFSATFKVPENVKWLKLNYKNTGFYAVHYKDESWAALGEALSHNVSVLTQEDRASLIHNVFALSKFGRVSFLHVLNLLDYLVNETETSPVKEALLQLNTIYRLLDKRQEHGLVARMKDYMLRQFGPLINSQTWKEEERVSKQELRAALLETACRLDEESCTAQAKTMFVKYKESNGTFRIPGDLQQVVFNVAAQSSEHWTSLLEMYTHVPYDAEKRKMLLALASTPDVKHISWVLAAGLQGDIIQTQELPLVINRVSSGFAQDFFSRLKDRGSQMRSVQEALETIRLNQRWMDTNLPTLKKWL
uniref:Aminopeptidase n=1 Tax=Takifugu rubripes TaxID=31033 RepID=A0A674NZY2_TAKRU